MTRILALAPWLGLMAYQALGVACSFRPEVLRPLTLGLCLALAPIIWYRRLKRQASDLELAVAAYLLLALVGFWVFPGWLGRAMSTQAAAMLYGVFFLAVALPPLWGHEPFTCHFARRQTPESVWGTDLFKDINRKLTSFWAVLFALSFLLSLAGNFWLAATPRLRIVFAYLLPVALLAGIGAPLNRWYPAYRRRRLGLPPEDVQALTGQAVASRPIISSNNSLEIHPSKEGQKMSRNHRVVALNGSPHEGFGNTSQMLAMLRDALAQEGFDLEEICLSRHRIEYCVGCALCLQQGACWIRDDHKGLMNKLLEADAVILASPVYFRNVTGQMKTFLDRSLGYGHRPRDTWKPGLAVCVSAGWGETPVAQYLSQVLRVFGAFAVGQLTAIAVGPGGFLGRETVAARAADLARYLAKAAKEGRRFPASDQDLDYWNFMGGLVRENREFMQADYEHWQKLGIMESFESYVGQSRTVPTQDPELRKAWLKGLMDRQKNRSAAPVPAAATGPLTAQTARELLESMPQGLDPAAAAGLSATYQFEVRGSENFTAHLHIDNQKATFQEGPAANPQVIIKTPAEIWLAIARGELDGQQAFMTGKFAADGDLTLLMKLKSLFPG
jgi:multimeric flavodoxin WrbA/putative sterol carrier protein